NATNRRLLTQLAESWGMSAVSVDSGARALEVLTVGQAFHGAVLDRQMRGMDGVLLAKTIRRLEGIRDLPLLLLTSGGMPAEAGALFAAALSRPLHPDRLREALASAVRS